MFKALKIMQDSLQRHKEAAEKLCAITDPYCPPRLPEPIKKVATNNNFARPE